MAQREHFLHRLLVWLFHLSTALPQHNKPITKVILLVDNILNCYMFIVIGECFDFSSYLSSHESRSFGKRSGWSSWPDQQTKMIELDRNPAQFSSSIATSYDGQIQRKLSQQTMLKMRKKQGKRQRNMRSIRAVPIFSSCMFWRAHLK